MALAPLSQTLLVTVPGSGAAPLLSDRVTIPVVVTPANTRINSTVVRANAAAIAPVLASIVTQINALKDQL